MSVECHLNRSLNRSLLVATVWQAERASLACLVSAARMGGERGPGSSSTHHDRLHSHAKLREHPGPRLADWAGNGGPCGRYRLDRPCHRHLFRVVIPSMIILLLPHCSHLIALYLNTASMCGKLSLSDRMKHVHGIINVETSRLLRTNRGPPELDKRDGGT